MKLIWHLVVKDVTRHRWPLLAWLMMLLAPTVLGLAAQQEAGAELEAVIRFQQANALLLVVQFSMGYLLVSSFVQDDELTGTHMFWLARPISGGRLLVAKVIGIGLLFALLPIICLLPWWLYCGFGAREIFWTAVETLGWQLLMIAPAFLLASLTADLGRTVMWSLLLVTVLAAGIIMLQAKLRISLGDTYRSSLSGVLFTRLWLAGVLLVLGAAIITVHQYLTRRAVRSFALAGANWIAVILVGATAWLDWSNGFDRTKLSGLGSAAPDTLGGITLTVAGAWEGQKLYRHPNEVIDYSELRVAIRARGLPEEMNLYAESYDQGWHWPGSLDLKRQGHGAYFDWGRRDYILLRKTLALPEVPPDAETEQWRAAAAAKRNAERIARGSPPFTESNPVAHPSEWFPMQASTALPASIVARMESDPPAYEVTVRGFVSTPRIVAEFPVAAGSRGQSSYRTFHVIEHQDGKIRLVTTVPSVCITGLWQGPMGRQTGGSGNARRDRPYLVNHVTGEIHWVSSDYAATPRTVQIGGVVVSWEALSVSLSRVVRAGRWVVRDPSWLEHSTLAVLADQEVGRFTRELKTEQLKVKRSFVAAD
jgi:hypothetical protein